MRFISLGIFLYVWLSLVWVLPIKLRWKLVLGAPLLIISQRFTIMYFWGGSVFFSPEIPRWILLVMAFCHALTIMLLFAAASKDTIWLLWALLRRFATSRIVKFPRLAASVIALTFAVIVTSWGLYSGTSVPQVNRITIQLPALPAEFNGTTIAVLADLHFSAINTQKFAQAVVDKTNELSPDIVAIPGDMFDGEVHLRESAIRELGRLKTKWGVFISPGNHEYFFGYPAWSSLINSLPNTVFLENSNSIIKSGDAQLAISGVTDAVATRYGLPGPDIIAAVNGLPKDITTLLLAHRPILAQEDAAQNVDLVLSGHTHGGMICFLKPFIAAFNGGVVAGEYQIKKTKLYISNGSGIWNGFPIRIGVPPEITLITLESTGQNAYI